MSFSFYLSSNIFLISRDQMYLDLPDDVLRHAREWYYVVRHVVLEYYICHADALGFGVANTFPFGTILRIRTLDARLLSLMEGICQSMLLPVTFFLSLNIFLIF